MMQEWYVTNDEIRYFISWLPRQYIYSSEGGIEQVTDVTYQYMDFLYQAPTALKQVNTDSDGEL